MNLLTATIDALRAAGMPPAEPDRIRLDGVLCRFDAEGDKRGKRNGWCVVFGDTGRPVVVFGHWSRGIRESLVLGDTAPPTPAERERQRNAIAQAKAARESQLRHAQAQARDEAVRQWMDSEPAGALHPYLVRKGITTSGCRQRHGSILIPLRDESGRIWNLQRIRADGQKRFLRGGRVAGLYAPLGGPVRDHLVICEGWATGKSLQAATGLPVAVAFSAGNLLGIATAMRTKYPDARLTIAADNDAKPDGSNPGLAAAKAAAAAVNGHLAVPPIVGDFNDYAALRGLTSTEEATAR